MLQGSFRVWFPSHCLPPYKGSCSTFRFEVFTPPSHFLVHSDHIFHSPQIQSTEIDIILDYKRKDYVKVKLFPLYKNLAKSVQTYNKSFLMITWTVMLITHLSLQGTSFTTFSAMIWHLKNFSG